jgi:energy-coupling factor transport system ATP-binding protein
MAMIKVDHVSFSYEPKHPVLKDVSFTIPQGQFVTLMGHNGSGKSTLAKLLAGLLEVKEGSVVIDSIVLSMKTLAEIRKKLGIVFQNPDNQFIGATVADDLAFGLENRQVPHEQMQTLIDAYAKQVGMSSFLHQEPSSLSGGQKQITFLLRELIANKKIFIFDEPTSALDDFNKELVLNVIKNIRDKTVIIITHDMDFISYVDKTYTIKDGNISIYKK